MELQARREIWALPFRVIPDERQRDPGPESRGGGWVASWVYIMASRPYETLYTGVTTDLARRAYEHRTDLVPGFTSRYGVKALVWYEEYDDLEEAIRREKQIKRWHRKWKFELIEKMNPEWADLYETMNR
ncbi:GIY-YIG nuclease family protein [Stappia sp. 28M-7]|nr:GIY-YIG nuclease family protein [Stappia sp. 28M-7]